MTIYQAKRVAWRRLDGTVAEFGPCTVVVSDSGMAEVNILGNPVPNTDGTHTGSVDRIDFVTDISRLDLDQVSR